MEVFLEILEEELESVLAGSGFRVIAVDDGDSYVAKLLLPSEFMITFRVPKDDKVLMKMCESVDKVIQFKDMYMDGALNPGIAKAFLDLPGVFTFVTDEIDIRAKRLIGILMEDLYGRHNIYALNVTEECVRVDTRGGRFYFHYTDFNISVKKELELMGKTMSKPLRKRYQK